MHRSDSSTPSTTPVSARRTLALTAALGTWQLGLGGVIAWMAVEPMQWFWTLPLPLFALGLVVWLELFRRVRADQAMQERWAVEETPIEAEPLPVETPAPLPASVEIDIALPVSSEDLEEELVGRAELDDTLRRLALVEASMTTLVERLPVGIVTSNRRGDILELNEAAERLFGHTAGDLDGLTMRVLLPGVFGTDSQKAISRDRDPLADAPEREPLRTYALRADYNTIPVLCSCIRLQTEAGERLTWVIHPLEGAGPMPNVVKPSSQALDSTARYAEDFRPPPETVPPASRSKMDETVRPPADSVPPYGGYVPESTGPFLRSEEVARVIRDRSRNRG